MTESLLDRPTTRPALESLPRRGVVGLVLVLPVRWRCYREHRSPIRWPGRSCRGRRGPRAVTSSTMWTSGLDHDLDCGRHRWAAADRCPDVGESNGRRLRSVSEVRGLVGRDDLPRCTAAGARLRFWRNARELVERTPRWLPWWCAPSRHFSNSSPRVAIGSSRCLATRVISVRGQPSSRWC